MSKIKISIRKLKVFLKANSPCLPAGRSKLKARDGQSLTEILIAISIAAILIIGGAAAITLSVRQESEVRANQAAVNFIDALMDGVRTASENNWHSIYDLSKGSDNKYFIVASTTPIAVLGEESVVEQAPSNGLVGHWKLDESTGAVAYDSSGNYLNGTTTSATITASSSCKAGQCLSFDGNDDDVLIGNPANLNLTSAITISAWVKFNATGTYQVIVGKSGSSSTGEGYTLMGYNNNVFKHYLFATNGSGCINTFGSYTTGNWYHVVVAHDGTIVKTYVDGNYINQTACNGLKATSINLQLGQYGPSNTWHFNGLIDDVRIYNRALSATEILNMYKSKIFTRNFYVENVNRDTSNNIAESGTDDPSTQKIIITSNWIGARSLSKSEYITRSNNRVFNQRNWSGGSGQDGPITNVNSSFSTSTKIEVSTSGTIKIAVPE